MNIEALNIILIELEKIPYRKYRNHKLSKMIRKLIDEYQQTDDQNRKYEIQKEVHHYVYRIFNGCLSKESREQLSNIGCTINEYCYQIEQHEKNGWLIGFQGVQRYKEKDGQFVQAGFIPREFQKGFYLEERVVSTEEEKKDKILENNFYYQYVDHLNRISDLMDRKAMIITYDYSLADFSINRAFVELLIDYLRFSRVNGAKVKEQDVAKKKTNEN